ncbi:MAG TPA: asparagine synthase [Rhodospirillales bacterium]|nr:asparagine synthase [Rhodospirillales bacterium]
MTLGFDEFAGGPHDEVPLAEDIAHHYGTRHHTVRVAGRDFNRHLDDLLITMDQPSIDGVNTYFVAKAAKQVGLKVALSGLGGDELFCGYDVFRQVPRLVGAFGRIPGGAALGRHLRSLLSPLGALGMPPKAAGLLEYGCRYGDAYLLRRALMMPWELEKQLAGVMAPEMIRQGLEDLNISEALDQCQRHISAPERKLAALEMSWYMRSQLLRDADWAGMAHGVEIRVPLVDPVLFAGLSANLGTDIGATKQHMAAAARRPLPSAVLERPKSGFFVPVRDWLQGGSGGRGLRGWARRVYQAQIA